jgi:TPR repeat protein
VKTYYSYGRVARWLWILASSIAFAFFCIAPATAESYEDGLAARQRGDYATAFEIWRRLAERGDPGAENGLGVLYCNGEGVPKDDAEALKWFQLSAAQHYAKAEFNLGLQYEEGRGVDRDYARAMKYYSLAADQGLGSVLIKGIPDWSGL